MEQQAFYLLIIRHLNKETNAGEEQVLQDWLNANPANRDTYSTLQQIWQAGRMQDEELINKGYRQVRQRFMRRKLIQWTSVAAAAIVAAVIATTLISREAPYKEAIAGGKVTKVRLEDGTQVYLSPSAKIRYRQREIILDGEAFFEVDPQPHQPFSVRAGDLQIAVLGTSFNVSDTAVSLVNGKVRVTVKDRVYMLAPGEQLYYNKDSQQCAQRQYDIDEVTGWRSSLLVFRNEPLANAANRIAQLYNVQIVFTDDEVKAYRLFAKFDNKPLEYVLEMIKAADDIDYSIKDKTVYISKKQ